MAEGKLTAKMERFVLAYLESQNASQAARVAGYSPKTAFRAGQVNMQKSAIKARLQVLEKKAAVAAEETVMSLVERQQRLSEMGRGRIVDFLTENGAGIEVGRDSPNVGAVMELTTEHVEGTGPLAVIKKKVKLHNPISAIAELNKMDHVYETGAVVDNRTQVLFLRQFTIEELREMLGKMGEEGGS